MEDKNHKFKDLSARRGNEESEMVPMKEKMVLHSASSPEGDDGSTEKKMKRLTLEPVQ